MSKIIDITITPTDESVREMWELKKRLGTLKDDETCYEKFYERYKRPLKMRVG